MKEDDSGHALQQYCVLCEWSHMLNSAGRDYVDNEEAAV